MNYILVLLIFFAPSRIQTEVENLHPSKADDSKPFDKIVGGHKVDIKTYPSLVSIHKYRGPTTRHYCGGTIIDKYHILTATHCVLSLDGHAVSPNDFKVYVGTQDIHHHGQVYYVDKIFAHDNYSSSTVHNDIAVMRLKDEMKFGPEVQMVKLAREKMFGGKEPADFYNVSEMCMAVGYGLQAEGSMR